jgi:isoamylase
MLDQEIPLADFDLELGRSDRLGAIPDADGTNFALFSEHATRVELCLFDPTGAEQTHSIDLPAMEGGIWYGYLPGIRPGQLYGYRVHGREWAKLEGHAALW